LARCWFGDINYILGLRFAAWQEVTIFDGLYEIGIVVPLPEYEWKGIEALVHRSILWIGELNLGLALFTMGLAMLLIESLVIGQYNRLDRYFGARRTKRRRQELGYEE